MPATTVRHQHAPPRAQPRQLPAPGAAQPDRPARGGPVELAGDQEAGDDEEDVDAAGDPVEPDVVDHDQGRGERPQALQFGAEASF